MKKLDGAVPRKREAKDMSVPKRVGTRYGKHSHGCENEYLINKEMPDALKNELDGQLSDGEKILFAIVGDLTSAGNYGDSAFVATDKRLVVVSE